MGFAERVDMMENDAGHNYNTLQREAVARWMSRWLLDKNQAITEPPITLLSEQEYQCTPDGKVMSLPGARSVYDLNEDYENELAKPPRGVVGQRRSGGPVGAGAAAGRHPQAVAVAQAGGRVAGHGRPSGIQDREAPHQARGRRLAAGAAVPAREAETRAGRVVRPPTRARRPTRRPGGPIEQLVEAGQSVLAVDLRGTGQTQAAVSSGGYSAEFQDAYLAYLLGRSYVGMRAEDVLVVGPLRGRAAAGGQGGAVRLVAVGNVGVPALHAAALEPSLFQSVKITGMLASWSSVIHGRLNKGLVTQLVHGALVHYDLPDLAASLGNKITVEQPVNALGAVIQESKGK